MHTMPAKEKSKVWVMHGTLSSVNGSITESMIITIIQTIFHRKTCILYGMPLPVTGIGKFTYPVGQEVQIGIYDTSGKPMLIKHDTDQDGVTRVDFSSWNKEVYFYKLIDSGGIIRSGKIIKE
jgi:hypothetical protein